MNTENKKHKPEASLLRSPQATRRGERPAEAGSRKLEAQASIFYITEKAHRLALSLQGLYHNADIEKFSSAAVKRLWNKSENLIFIMASGIVVRTIAPLIKDKRTDPAVVVLDENGKFAISLLSGHLGGANRLASEVAKFLGGVAVITTASDVNNMPSIDLWAKENALIIENPDDIPGISTGFLNSGIMRVYSDIGIELPKEFHIADKPESADIIITSKSVLSSPLVGNLSSKKDAGQAGMTNSEGKKLKGRNCLLLRPKNLIVGIGCNSKTPESEIEDAIRKVMKKNNLSFLSIHSIATIDKKGSEPGLIAFAKKYKLEIKTFSADELNSAINYQPSVISISDAAFKATGVYAVAEPAALLASRSDKLLVPKHKMGNVTIAISECGMQNAEFKSEIRIPHSEIPKLYIVGTGPGSIEHITPYAREAIRKSNAIVGYGTYLGLIKEIIKDKEVISTGMTREVDRCRKAVELAISGKTVAVISGGDPGIYAMAGLVFEILRSEQQSGRAAEQQFYENDSATALLCYCATAISVEVIPGISALNASAARLGAPLMHDFAAISLSDRLTPWELIKKRLEAAAKADFVIVLYNPKSMGRQEHIRIAQEIILKHRIPETPAGIVKGAMRENESITITTLKDMLEHDIDMQTSVIIGNSKTFIWDKWMITPRGYEGKLKGES